MFLYKERLNKLEVFTLEKDMSKGGMWQKYKFISDMEKTTKKQLFTISSNKNITGHSINYVGKFKRIRRRYSSHKALLCCGNPCHRTIDARSLHRFVNLHVSSGFLLEGRSYQLQQLEIRMISSVFFPSFHQRQDCWLAKYWAWEACFHFLSTPFLKNKAGLTL